MIEKLAEEEQPKNKNKFLHSPAMALRGTVVALAVWRSRAAPLMTSAEQAAGRAALVVLIKSENGQNTSNAQPVDPSLAHTRVTRHRYGTSHMWETTARAGFCPFCGHFGQENRSIWFKGEDQRPNPSLSCG